MSKHFLFDAIGWGFGLWLIGYALGIVLFFAVPSTLIGWVITPIGVAITLWVLLKKIHAASLTYYLGLAAVWTLVAIMCDYFFLVKVFKPADGYYKLDVFVYYAFTLLLPSVVGWLESRQKG